MLLLLHFSVDASDDGRNLPEEKKKLRKVKIAGGKGKGREEVLASGSIGMDELVLGTGAKRVLFFFAGNTIYQPPESTQIT